MCVCVCVCVVCMCVLMHVYLCTFVGVHVSRHLCGRQRTTCISTLGAVNLLLETGSLIGLGPNMLARLEGHQAPGIGFSLSPLDPS